MSEHKITMSDITMAEFKDKYMRLWAQYEKENRPSQLKSKLSIFRRSIIPFFGEKQIEKITQTDIMEFKGYLRGKGIKPKTMNNELTLLRNIFKAARAMDMAFTNLLVEPVKMNKNVTKEQERIPEKDIDKILSQVRAIHWWVADICLLMLETGIRVGEARALKWDKVILPTGPDDGFGLLVIDETTSGHEYALGPTKGAPRFVPLTPKSLGLLKGLNRVNKFLFPNSREPMQPCSLGIISEALRKLQKDGHVGYRVYPHLFRHTYASRARDAGVEIDDIQILLGHVDRRTTDRYAHRDTKKLHEAVARMMAANSKS